MLVFLVETGRSLRLSEIDVFSESVSALRYTIARVAGIPVEKQVLLTKDGIVLEPPQPLSNYTVGTESNPVYLFSKSTIESNVPPTGDMSWIAKGNLRNRISSALHLAAVKDSLVVRSRLAAEVRDDAAHIVNELSRLAVDQDWQVQGWGAVTANLKSTEQKLRCRHESVLKEREALLAQRQEYLAVLDRFDTQVRHLRSVVLPPGLRQSLTSSVKSSSLRSSSDGAVTSSTRAVGEVLTLFDWIQVTSGSFDLLGQASQCRQGIVEFESPLPAELQERISEVYSKLENLHMLQIDGIDERLNCLHQIAHTAQVLLKELKDTAMSLQNHVSQLNIERDPRILSDLCTTHKGYLQMMAKNYDSLSDLCQRSTNSKAELSDNLHKRLRWVMYMHRNIAKLDSDLLVLSGHAKALVRKMNCLEQVASVPDQFARALVEVARRQAFVGHYMEWTTWVAEQAKVIYSKEVSHRKQFSSQLNGHIINALFPGLNDLPSKFAVERPARIDRHLPVISRSDVEEFLGVHSDICPRITIKDVDSEHVKSLVYGSSGHIAALKQELAAQQRHHEEQLQKRDAELEDLRASVLQAKDQCKSIELDLEVRVKRECQEVARLSSELERSTIRLKEQQQLSNNQEGSILKWKEQFAAKEKEFEDIMCKQELACEESKREADELRASLASNNELLQKFQTELGEYKQLQEKRESLLDATNKHVAELEKQLHAKSSELDKYKQLQEKRESLLAAANKRVAELEKQLHAKSSELSCMSASFTSAGNRVREVEQLLTKEREMLQSEQHGTSERLNKLNDALHKKQGDIDRLLVEKKDLEKLLAEQRDSAQCELEALQKKWKEEEAHLRVQAKKDLELLKSSLMADLNAKVKDVQKKLQDNYSKEIAELQSAHAVEIKEAREAASSEAGLLVKVSNLEQELVASQTEVCKQKELMEVAIKKSFAKYQVDKTELRKACDTKTQQIEEMSERNAQLEAQLKEMEKKKCALADKEQDLCHEVEQLTTKLHKSEADRDNYFGQYLECERDLKASQRDRDELEKKICRDGERQGEVSKTAVRAQPAATSVDSDPLTLSRSKKNPKITVKDFELGDIALFVHDAERDMYVAFSMSPTLHFLHAKSTKALCAAADQLKGRRYLLGTITDKELCAAKKPSNRFRLPSGTRFYRLQASPFIPTGTKQVMTTSTSTSASSDALATSMGDSGLLTVSASEAEGTSGSAASTSTMSSSRMSSSEASTPC